MKFLNLGGGLGVDYDGSKTAFDSSMNYTVQEYANDIVYTIKSICDEEKVPVPTLVTESGRALTAYHSVLVTNVLDVADRIEQGRTVKLDGDENHVVRELYDVWQGVTAKNVRESYHDALQYKEELFTLFNLGYVSLEDRSKGEILYWNICDRIRRYLHTLKDIPEEFEQLEVMLADKYVMNFSVFQSLPDVWAIDQLFPILPIHRLRERPTEHGHARRHHVRLGRQDREVHRPAGTSRKRCPSTSSARARPTTSASASSGRTRTSSATSTTSSARRTRCSRAWTRTAARASRTSSRASRASASSRT